MTEAIIIGLFVALGIYAYMYGKKKGHNLGYSYGVADGINMTFLVLEGKNIISVKEESDGRIHITPGQGNFSYEKEQLWSIGTNSAA